MVHNEVVGGLGYVGYLTGLNNEFIESLWREKSAPGGGVPRSRR